MKNNNLTAEIENIYKDNIWLKNLKLDMNKIKDTLHLKTWI